MERRELVEVVVPLVRREVARRKEDKLEEELAKSGNSREEAKHDSKDSSVGQTYRRKACRNGGTSSKRMRFALCLPHNVNRNGDEHREARGLREQRGNSAERAGTGKTRECNATHQNGSRCQPSKRREPVVGEVGRALIVEREEEQSRQKTKPLWKNKGGDPCEHPAEGQTCGDRPRGEYPGVDAEDAEACGVEILVTGSYEREEVAEWKLAVHDAQAAREELLLIAKYLKRNAARQEVAEVEKDRGPRYGNGHSKTRRPVCGVRQYGILHGVLD